MVKLILFLALNLNFNNMDYIRFESLLGKNITVAEAITGNIFEESNINIDNFENKHYSIKSNQYDNSCEIKDFYGMSYQYIFIQTDKNDVIQSITIYFKRLIDRQFYDAFNKVYGKPNSILVIEKRTVISEGNVDNDTIGFNQYARKSELELREGSFEENPLYLIWEKEKYQIKALLRHKQNVSEITFNNTYKN